MSVFFILKPKENSLWAEEKEEDAVWGVFLKKIRYQRHSAIVQLIPPTPPISSSSPGQGYRSRSNASGASFTSNTSSANIDEVDSDQGEIAHLMWETVRVKVLRAGTLRKIVEAMSNEDSDVQVGLRLQLSGDFPPFPSPSC